MDMGPMWERLLAVMQSAIGQQNVEIWLKAVTPVRLDDDTLVLQVDNPYYSDWIGEHYLADLEHHASGLTGRSIHVQWTIKGDGPPASAQAPRATERPPDEVPEALGLNVDQTFQNFVVGPCNSFAHAACAAVAESPAQRYNPLYIYGGTGLGKTHLMHAVGNHIVHDADARVVYVTAEDFMNEMINCIRYKRMEEFRNKYRKRASTLLVDDIQFLSGKDRTQEEFFHTFNALRASGRQIILTSDVPPREIEKLEPRLRTRFEGGLLADIQAPDKETLLAILYAKAEPMGLQVPSDLADTIANRVQGNIRELEGVLNRLVALNNFYNEPMTLEFARAKLPDVFAPEPTQLTVAAIIDAVARFHSLRSADIIGTKRTRTLTRPRHIAMYMARKHTNLSYPELGREFGGRDHSTIQHGCRKVEKQLKDNADLSYKIRLIEQGLNVRTM
mgnify:CR=1 FL=1